LDGADFFFFRNFAIPDQSIRFVTAERAGRVAIQRNNPDREAEMSDDQNRHGGKGMKSQGMFGGVYGLAFIGAAVYFIQHAESFWGGVLGFFKAVFWPAMVMYKVLELLKL
ncbi:MAG TPA: hypothetical protein VK569_06700, partial [Bacteroidota bacterium]|nr:hypothetical protein [Bacteroidota bacterium]